jgi:gas vesicle protein
MNQMTQASIDKGTESAAMEGVRSITNGGSGGGWSTTLSYLLIGGGIGAGLALLFAPKAGTELRGDLSSAAQRGLEGTRDLAGKVVDHSKDLYSTLKEKADQYTGGAASQFENNVLNMSGATGTNMPNSGGEILEGLSDGAITDTGTTGGKEKGTGKSSATGF